MLNTSALGHNSKENVSFHCKNFYVFLSVINQLNISYSKALNGIHFVCQLSNMDW